MQCNFMFYLIKKNQHDCQINTTTEQTLPHIWISKTHRQNHIFKALRKASKARINLVSKEMMFQRVDAITEKVLFLHNSVIGESQGMPLLMYLMG